LNAEALPRPAAAFQRTHAPLELGQVSRTSKVLVAATLFGAFEPAANPGKKEGEHNILQKNRLPVRQLAERGATMYLSADLFWRCRTIQS
jgi:hypothetical protein